MDWNDVETKPYSNACFGVYGTVLAEGQDDRADFYCIEVFVNTADVFWRYHYLDMNSSKPKEIIAFYRDRRMIP